MADDELKLSVAPENSPDRCLSGNDRGQCKYLKYPGTDYCPRHMGRSGHEVRKRDLHNYALTRFRNQIVEKAYSSRLKSLTEEIAILRFTLEKLLESCNDDFDLILYQSKITELVKAIASTVESCHKMEEKANLVLDKNQLVVIANRLIGLLTEKVDPELLPSLADDIILAFENPIDQPALT